MKVIHSIVEAREGDIVEFYHEKKLKYKGILATVSSEIAFGEVIEKLYDPSTEEWIIALRNNRGIILITEKEFIKALR